MADPTITDNVVYEQSDSYSIGDYSYPIVVDPNTIYEVRAFVEDSEGNIYYGETVEVTTVLLVDLTIDPKLPELLAAGQKAGGFLGLGSMKTYRRDNYMAKVFNKWGIALASNEKRTNQAQKIQQIINNRIAAYQLPERSAAQQKLLQTYLPTPCRY